LDILFTRIKLAIGLKKWQLPFESQEENKQLQDKLDQSQEENKQLV